MKTDQQSKFLTHFLVVFLLCVAAAFAQTTTPFTQRYETQGINGDLTIIGNSILGDSPDTPYNGDTQNNFIDMVFVDVDNNPNTFNSSSARFTTNSCNRVVYAGLYWGAVSAPANLEPENIKFRVPGRGYQDITADETIDLIYYKDVTSLVAGNNNVSGDYWVANISSSEGQSSAAPVYASLVG